MIPRATLRPAGTDDGEFLFQVFFHTRQGEFAAAGWAPAELETFLRAQHDLQDRSYRSAYPRGEFQVIELDRAPVGRLYLDRGPRIIHIIDIALLPGCRGRGLGTELLGALTREADALEARMSLEVEAASPARQLYRRLGFQETGAPGFHQRMERPSPRALAMAPGSVPGPERSI